MNESVQRLESKYAEARSEESMDIDLNDSVQRLEAKCAGVREELGRMALSEQYMRTKQAQLRARKKELEAKEATIKAELREKEAYVSIKNFHDECIICGISSRGFLQGILQGIPPRESSRRFLQEIPPGIFQIFTIKAEFQTV